MSYISDETFTGLTSATLTLANNAKAGTILIKYNDKLFYEWRDDGTVASYQKTIVMDFAPVATDTQLVSYYTETEPSTLNAQRYISARQIHEWSRVTTLVATSAVTVEKLIREAEFYIDSLVGNWKKYYDFDGSSAETSNQLLTFPRIEDDDTSESNNDYPAIPAAITKAALFATENIFLAGAQSVASSGNLKSEKFSDYSYTKFDSQNSSFDLAKSIIGPKAFAVMSGYIKTFDKLSLEDESANYELLNSRQRFDNDNR